MLWELLRVALGLACVALVVMTYELLRASVLRGGRSAARGAGSPRGR